MLALLSLCQINSDGVCMNMSLAFENSGHTNEPVILLC